MTNITVALRVRPLISTEQDFVWNINENNIDLYPQFVNATNINQAYGFTSILLASETTEMLYQNYISQLTQKMLQGANSTVMAYGQSGSGKTFTVFGQPGQNNGLMHFVLQDAFEKISSDTCRIRIQFVELYNEIFTDLLTSGRTNLGIPREENGQIIIPDAEQVVIKSMEHFNQVLDQANKQRTVAETNLNQQSSRSHAIMRFIFDINDNNQAPAPQVPRAGKIQKFQRQSILNIIDLAGSEKLTKSGATGQRMKEAQNINQSLLTLGMVVSALASKQPHVPYRDSKLTRLLQQSLGGECLTTIIGCISPTLVNVEETINTLRFCSRAMKIQNKQQVFKMEKVTDAQHIEKLVLQNKQLKQRIAELEGLSYQSSANASCLHFSQMQSSNVSISQQDIMEIEQYKKSSDENIHIDQLLLLQQQLEQDYSEKLQKIQDQFFKKENELKQLQQQQQCQVQVCTSIEKMNFSTQTDIQSVFQDVEIQTDNSTQLEEKKLQQQSQCTMTDLQITTDRNIMVSIEQVDSATNTQNIDNSSVGTSTEVQLQQSQLQATQNMAQTALGETQASHLSRTEMLLSGLTTAVWLVSCDELTQTDVILKANAEVQSEPRIFANVGEILAEIQIQKRVFANDLKFIQKLEQMIAEEEKQQSVTASQSAGSKVSVQLSACADAGLSVVRVDQSLQLSDLESQQNAKMAELDKQVAYLVSKNEEQKRLYEEREQQLIGAAKHREERTVAAAKEALQKQAERVKALEMQLQQLRETNLPVGIPKKVAQ